jgi:hypothetical protein
VPLPVALLPPPPPLLAPLPPDPGEPLLVFTLAHAAASDAMAIAIAIAMGGLGKVLIGIDPSAARRRLGTWARR